MCMSHTPHILWGSNLAYETIRKGSPIVAWQTPSTMHIHLSQWAVNKTQSMCPALQVSKTLCCPSRGWLAKGSDDKVSFTAQWLWGTVTNCLHSVDYETMYCVHAWLDSVYVSKSSNWFDYTSGSSMTINTCVYVPDLHNCGYHCDRKWECEDKMSYYVCIVARNFNIMAIVWNGPNSCI